MAISSLSFTTSAIIRNQFTFNSKRVASAAHAAYSPSLINLMSKIVDPSTQSRLIASPLYPNILSNSGSLNFGSLVITFTVKQPSEASEDLEASRYLK